MTPLGILAIAAGSAVLGYVFGRLTAKERPLVERERIAIDNALAALDRYDRVEATWLRNELEAIFNRTTVGAFRSHLVGQAIIASMTRSRAKFPRSSGD